MNIDFIQITIWAWEIVLVFERKISNIGINMSLFTCSFTQDNQNIDLI